MTRTKNKSYYHFFVEKQVNSDHTISKYFKTQEDITNWFGIQKSTTAVDSEAPVANVHACYCICKFVLFIIIQIY